MLNLKADHLAIVKIILAVYVPNMAVWAYGSRISGKSHSGSDLDLVVINPQDSSLPQQNLAALRTAFAESNLPILVDILDWAIIPASFRKKLIDNMK